MMEDQNKIRFIRKNGRIIPIHPKKPKMTDQEKGVASIGAGVAVAGVGGLAAGVKLRKAEKISQMTFDFMEDKPNSKLPKGVVDIHDGFVKARTKMRVAKRFSVTSRWAASGLIFMGVSKALKNEKDSEAKELAKVGAAAASGEIVSRGIYAGFKKKLPFAMPFSSEAKKASVRILKSVFKKTMT